MIKVQNVSRNFGSLKALKDLSFEVAKGEIFGIIGPDGSGKTTLFRIMATLLLADRGKITVNDLDVAGDFKSIRKITGYMPGRFSLYQDLTVEENLSFFATVFNTSIKENYHLIKDIYCQIEPFKKRKAGALSGGMKQKLALCCALIHFPVILLLDEPTTGVDPVSRAEFWDMLIALKQQGITIVVSTPYMDEAERCDRIALMQNGSFLVADTPEKIRSRYDRKLLSVKGGSMYRLLRDLRKIPEITSCFSFGDSHHISYIEGETSVEKLRALLASRGHSDITITPISAGIEDCFMSLSGTEGSL